MDLGQRDAGRRLGERITDVTFWRNELKTELEKLVTESQMLADSKRKVTKSLQDLDPPLHIGQECLYHRENRQSIEKVHDHVEKSLLIEIDNLKTCQEKLRQLIDRVIKILYIIFCRIFKIIFTYFRFVLNYLIVEQHNLHLKKI